jgi:hypothetical protein
VDDLPDLIGWHPAAYDADHVTLIPADQIGKSFGLSLSNPPEEVALLR